MSFWILIGLLALAAGLLARRKVRDATRSRGLTDDMVRRIETRGRLEWEDEELDLEEIRAEEDEFWSRTWDEPEPL